MIKGVHHASITVSDIDKSIAFYRDVLGLRLVYTVENSGEETSRNLGVREAKLKIAILRAGKDTIELIQYVTPKGKHNDRIPCDIGNMHVAFRVSDIYRVYSELRERGVRFNASPLEIREGPMKGWIWAYFSDPDGAQLELLEETEAYRFSQS